MLDPRNVVPFYELPIFRTTNLPNLPPRPNLGQATAAGAFSDPPTVSLQSSNIQLNGIPDKLIIFVRKLVQNLHTSGTDSYATIQRISINWNNQAGILSSMTPQQLYRNSVQSGLANLSWDEFCGNAVSVCGYNDGSQRSQTQGPIHRSWLKQRRHQQREPGHPVI
jgi:hypothetical protein